MDETCLTLLRCDGVAAIIKERCKELVLWIESCKVDLSGNRSSNMFLNTSIRIHKKSVEATSHLLKFLNKTKYEDWINDEYGARFADFEMEGTTYKIVFYSKKMDFKEFDDWDNEYMLVVLN